MTRDEATALPEITDLHFTEMRQPNGRVLKVPHMIERLALSADEICLWVEPSGDKYSTVRTPHGLFKIKETT